MTISAVIFIAGARTMVITTKIKQLQYYNQFNEIFVLSLFLLFTNIIFKVIFQRMAKREARTEASAGIGADVSLAERKSVRIAKRITAAAVSVVLVFAAVSLVTGGRNSELVVIYSNGAYGERMEDIAKHAGLSYRIYHQDYDKIPDAEEIGRILTEDPSITHVAMVHSETTSGILNDIQAVGKTVKAHGCTFIVDAMSSFEA